jgi:hypothetical protein
MGHDSSWRRSFSYRRSEKNSICAAAQSGPESPRQIAIFADSRVIQAEHLRPIGEQSLVE